MSAFFAKAGGYFSGGIENRTEQRDGKNEN
jgi:hypothetical protein